MNNIIMHLVVWGIEYLYPRSEGEGGGVYCFTLVRSSVPPFRHIILSNHISWDADILHEALYRYDVSWDAFSDSSDIYFLFAEDLEFFKYSAPIQHFSSHISQQLFIIAY